MTDVQEAKAGYDRAVADVVEAEHLLSDAREGLQEVTGINYTDLAVLKEDVPLEEPEPAVQERWISLALTQNFGLRVSEQAVQIARADIEIQKAGHLPTLDATSSHIFATTGDRFGSADSEDTIVGLALNVPLYQGGRVNSRIRQAEHVYREAQATLKQTQRQYIGAPAKPFWT